MVRRSLSDVVEVEIMFVRKEGQCYYRWRYDDFAGEWQRTEAQTMFDFMLKQLEDLSKRVKDLEDKLELKD